MSVLQLAHHCTNWNSVNILDTFGEEYLSQRYWRTDGFNVW